MKESKLISILRTFSKEEFKEFEKFIDSPFFSTGRNLKPLYLALKKFYPLFESPKFSLENIFSLLHKNTAYNPVLMRRLLSDMTKLTEYYLINKIIKSEGFEINKSLAIEYAGRGLMNLFLEKFSEMKKFLGEQKIDLSYFDLKYTIERGEVFYNQKIDRQDLLVQNILKGGEFVIIVFLQRLTQAIADLEVNRKTYNARYDINLPGEFVKNLNLENFLQYCKNNKYEYYDIIALYYNLMMSYINEEDENYFNEARNLFNSNIEKFNSHESLNIAVALCSYCVTKIALGKEKYSRILFEIHKSRLEKNILMSPHIPIISKLMYMSIVSNAIDVNETDWAKYFIDNYSRHLHKLHRTSIKHLALAELYFKEKNFDGVFDNLKKIKPIDSLDKTQVKILTIASFYERGETELVLNNIDSLTHFIKENSTVSDTRQQINNIFLKILKKITLLKELPDKSETAVLISEINSAGYFKMKKWLLEKVNELK